MYAFISTLNANILDQAPAKHKTWWFQILTVVWFLEHSNFSRRLTFKIWCVIRSCDHIFQFAVLLKILTLNNVLNFEAFKQISHNLLFNFLKSLRILPIKLLPNYLLTITLIIFGHTLRINLHDLESNTFIRGGLTVLL